MPFFRVVLKSADMVLPVLSPFVRILHMLLYLVLQKLCDKSHKSLKPRSAWLYLLCGYLCRFVCKLEWMLLYRAKARAFLPANADCVQGFPSS